MLDELIGCRLESIKLSKMSWTLEFQGRGSRPRHFLLSSSAAVSCVGSGESDQTVYDAIQQILEDELIEAQHDENRRVVTLRFREGGQIEFSNSNNQGGDNSAIVTNLADDAWELYS
jgi:hypothetical protein